MDIAKIITKHKAWLLCDPSGEKADLRGANLRRAYLRGADLRGADIEGANLQGADLQGANLWRANLQDANLWGANLQDANLWGANLQDAYLQRADLQDANLQDANLRRADLWGANLRGADLWGAVLWGAKLSWASHNLLSEILWRAADTEARQMLAAFAGRRTDWCWGRWAGWAHPERDWAIAELAKWVQDGDDAPELIRKETK